MRIILTHTSTLPDRIGGSERVMWEVGRALTALGHTVRIIARRTATRLPTVSYRDGVVICRYGDPVHSFATLYLPSILLAWKALRCALRAWDPDVVHAHHSIVGLAARGTGARRVAYTFHGPWHLEFLREVAEQREMPLVKRCTRRLWIPGKAALARRLEHAAVFRCDRVVVLSRYSATQLYEIHGTPSAPVRLIPGGVDLDRFAPTLRRRAAREAMGLPLDERVLFTVRRLVPRMGLDLLLRAIVLLHGVRLVVAGDGWLRPHLERLSELLGVSDRVRFVGFVSDVDLARYYQAADLVVLPSMALEGFGLITLEALACGTPVVATPESGAVDVLEPWEPGWIAADRTPGALAAVIERALAAAPDEARMRAHCRARAEQYSWARIGRLYEALYEELASG